MSTVSLAVIGLTGCTTNPEKLGLGYRGSVRADQVRLLVDETWVDAGGTRHVQQEIFDTVFEMIEDADRFILIDMFLLNDYEYAPGPGMRPLSEELPDRLVAKRRSDPEVDIVFISDPINTVYGSVEPPAFRRMEDAGVRVVWTDLDRMRDSNPVYSKPWRLLAKPFGTAPGNAVRNPLGEGRISLRSFLKLMNFKANHRKLIVTDRSLLVGSANPHSASSAHWNTALKVDGVGMAMALEAESAILRFSGAEEAEPVRRTNHSSEEVNGRLGDPSLPCVELLTEIRIRERVLELLERAGPGARIDLCMLYLSETDISKALVGAKERGCDVRIILDPNKDSFGRIKNGVPNRQTAAKLVKAGIPLRWADTHGEQCHAKMLYAEHHDGTATLLLGSGNYTRRNMNNFNCEADLAYTASGDDQVLQDAREVFDRWWNNSEGRFCTIEYSAYEDNSRWRRLMAWWKETTGMGTF